ncbi:MAG: hypothetical protein QOC62_1561 [Mycobacterium sp.]|jgi:hypothetical protein|nr:hypothetical protein [Mycobacterium sp.]
MILIALTVPALSLAVFGDPARQMYGPDGLLAFGRRAGFGVAEAATRDCAVSDGDRVGSLTAGLITHLVREPVAVEELQARGGPGGWLRCGVIGSSDSRRHRSTLREERSARLEPYGHNSSFVINRTNLGGAGSATHERKRPPWVGYLSTTEVIAM